MNEFDLKDLLNEDHPEILLEKNQPFLRVMMHFQCAIMEVETKIKVLNREFSLANQRNPIESIKARIKTPASILEKLQRRQIPLTIEGIEKQLNDVAGIRVICSFPQDIYNVAGLLGRQDDIIILEIKDYIANPKPNGYRSLHLILGVPIFLAEEKKIMKVEVQLRTIAMDFWASLEHKVKYKQNVDNPEEIAAELKECADVISGADYRMQEIANRISPQDDGGFYAL
ncbi:MAG: GTP pyrophosphokinase family protein [Lachnospiraceae bacterium]